jgi:hypothetical protein
MLAVIISLTFLMYAANRRRAVVGDVTNETPNAVEQVQEAN